MTLNDKIRLIESRLEALWPRLEMCDLCPRDCHVNRLKDKPGYCGTGRDMVIYTAFLHRGEEPPISGKNGSGTIFFSGCCLRCSYCQNYKFSHHRKGSIVSVETLSELILRLQDKGAHSLNLVTPTHFLPHILRSLALALKSGLEIPIVYNTSGYEKPEIIDMLGEIVDIYLPDIKYITPFFAQKYSSALNYPDFCMSSIKLMYQQKKNHWKGEVLEEGLIVRHLVIPSLVDETLKILLWLKTHAPFAYVSIMFQYRPYSKAHMYPEINRGVTDSECRLVRDSLENSGLEGWVQDLNSNEELSGVYFKKGNIKESIPST